MADSCFRAKTGNDYAPEFAHSRRRDKVDVSTADHPKIEIVNEPEMAVQFDDCRLSLHGAHICSDYLHCKGEHLKLRLHLPEESTPLAMDGEVVYAKLDNEPGMGVAFRNLDNTKKKRLHEFLAGQFMVGIDD